jgi:hypothetical protein
VASENAGDQALALGEGLVPADFDEGAVAPQQRAAQAVRVVVKFAEHGPLWTDVAFAPDVAGVGADGGNAVGVDRDLQTAHGFAEGTGSQVGRGHDGSSRRAVPDVLQDRLPGLPEVSARRGVTIGAGRRQGQA